MIFSHLDLCVGFLSLPCLNWHCYVGTHMYDILYNIAGNHETCFFFLAKKVNDHEIH